MYEPYELHPPPPPHLYCFSSTTATTFLGNNFTRALSTFLLFSLHHHHRLHHISIVFPPPPPPPSHLYCFSSTTATTFLEEMYVILDWWFFFNARNTTCVFKRDVWNLELWLHWIKMMIPMLRAVAWLATRDTHACVWENEDTWLEIARLSPFVTFGLVLAFQACYGLSGLCLAFLTLYITWIFAKKMSFVFIHRTANMVYKRVCRNCPISSCAAKYLVRLANHLADMMFIS